MRNFVCVLGIALLPGLAIAAENPEWAAGVLALSSMRTEPPLEVRTRRGDPEAIYEYSAPAAPPTPELAQMLPPPGAESITPLLHTIRPLTFCAASLPGYCRQ